jgi:regulator of protease activity HflC (stomatin/prohibitin superfamily)
MQRSLMIVCLCAMFALAGCKPYDVPEYVEIQANESAFMVKLQGDSTKQEKFDSVEFLEKNQVATKRVQIPHTWVQKGRLWLTGEYMDTVRVIKVDRTPHTREWTAAAGQSGQAVWVETKDSVELSIDIVCTAMIEPDNAALFLYRYPNGSLSTMMDKEVRARIQQELSEECAGYNLEELKQAKSELINRVRPKVTKFFSDRGITISALGLAGGLTYSNTEIQKAIDKTFQDQQLEISAQARYEAQLKENQTIKAKAEAEAEAARLKASGEAEGIKLLADAKAYEIQKAQSTGSMYIQLRQLEILNQTMSKWDGKLPVYNMGTGQTPQLLMAMPSQDSK